MPTSVKIKVVEPTEKDTPMLLSFPHGIPPNADNMAVDVYQRGKAKRKKRVVEGVLESILFQGSNIGGQSEANDLCKFAVAELDESTGELKVVEANHAYVMHPIHEDKGRFESQSNMTNYERKVSLTEAFGSRKKQRAMRAAASNTISSENISGAARIESTMTAAIEADTVQVADAAKEAIEQQRKQLLPTYNEKTSVISEAYPMEGLVPPHVVKAMKEKYEEFESGLDLSRVTVSSVYEQLSKDITHEYVLQLVHGMLGNILENKKVFKKNIIYALFLHYMVRFALVISTRPVKKTDLMLQLGNPPTQVLHHLAETFAIYQKRKGEAVYVSTKSLMCVDNSHIFF